MTGEIFTSYESYLRRCDRRVAHAVQDPANEPQIRLLAPGPSHDTSTSLLLLILFRESSPMLSMASQGWTSGQRPCQRCVFQEPSTVISI